MTHTPGPWEAIDNPDGIIDIVRHWDAEVTSGNSAAFGSVLGAHIAEVPYTITGIPTREQALANSALLAAAPELLEACHKALDGMYDQHPQYETMSSKEMRHPEMDCYAVEVILDIRAAIAKAEAVGACSECGGTGAVIVTSSPGLPEHGSIEQESCPKCNGGAQ